MIFELANKILLPKPTNISKTAKALPSTGQTLEQKELSFIISDSVLAYESPDAPDNESYSC